MHCWQRSSSEQRLREQLQMEAAAWLRERLEGERDRACGGSSIRELQEQLDYA